jgi:hypothetical protein
MAVSLNSGRPYSLLTGTDPYNTGQSNARPPGVPRNTLEGPDYASVDVRWSHEFAIGKARKGHDGPALGVGVDAFNVLNHVNYTSYIGTLTSPFFGLPVSSQPARRVQVSAEAHF